MSRGAGSEEEAVEAARAAVAIAPDDLVALGALARAVLAAGRDGDALTVARNAVRLYPQSADALAALAEVGG